MEKSGPSIPRDKPILLFDGVCNLCNGSVLWVIRRDPNARFRFASLQSELGQKLLTEAGLPASALNTVVLYADGEFYTRSDAALGVLARLGRPWSWLSVFRLIPRAVRNWVYGWIAKNRYHWFGKKESCMIPTPELRSRFLD